MKQPRLALLFVLMLGLIGLRWWVPPDTQRTADVVPAVAKGHSQPTPAQFSLERERVVASLGDLAAGTRDAEDGPALNAFAVRTPPLPTKPAPTAVAPAGRPFVGPPPPPPPVPPPPPPLQLIGGWNDERGASVFVAGPQGVVQGRVGDVLLSEYRITQIAPTQVLLTHLSSNRIVPLTMASGTLPPLTASR
jgi:hypothetical protein